MHKDFYEEYKNAVVICKGEKSDSDMLQNAIDTAEASGRGSVIIPEINPRTQKSGYELDRAILMPSDMTLYLDNCYITIADGVCDNMIRNKNMYTEGYGTIEKEQKNIAVIGIGHAVLDADGHNDVFEWSSMKDGRKHIAYNNILIFHNVDGFEVKNIELRNQRWWGLNFIFCSNGHIADITSRVGLMFSNQDGINLRYGCHHVTIERISGNSGDDFIALSAIGVRREGLYNHGVEGKDPAIHDVVVRDIVATSAREGIITLRCSDDGEMYNILIENVIESNYDNRNLLPYGTILLGQNAFYGKNPGVDGSIHHITLRNVYTKCGCACITLGNNLSDSLIENLHISGTINALTTTNYCRDNGGVILDKRFEGNEDGIKIKNVKIQNITVCGELEGSVFDFSRMAEDDYIENLEIKNVEYEGNNKLIECNDKVRNNITVDGRRFTV